MAKTKTKKNSSSKSSLKKSPTTSSRSTTSKTNNPHISKKEIIFLIAIGIFVLGLAAFTLALNHISTTDPRSYAFDKSLDSHSQIFENSDSSIVYSGSWSTKNRRQATNNSYSYTRQPGASATLEFEGNQISYIYTAARNRGDVEIYLDDQHIDTLDTHSWRTKWQQQVTYSDFEPGTHTFTIKHSGTSSFWNRTPATDLDAFVVTNKPPEESGCIITGCSSQLCSNQEQITTCEFLPEYACYQDFGICQKQSDGTCGWTQSEELLNCIQEKQNPQPQQACEQSGGEWKQFSDSCADTCQGKETIPELNQFCAQVITQSCDCGSDRCWNGSSCIDNPPSPSQTSETSPLTDPSTPPIPSPSLEPKSELIPTPEATISTSPSTTPETSPQR